MDKKRQITKVIYKDHRWAMCTGLALCLVIWAICVVRLILGQPILPEAAAMVILVIALGLVRQRSMGPDKDNPKTAASAPPGRPVEAPQR